MSLIDKLRKARETLVKAGGFDFTVRRPTVMEVIGMRGVTLKEGDILQRFVIGWNLTELDIIPGGTSVSVPFETELFMDWVADRPDLWSPLTAAVLDAYDAYQAQLDATLGKPEAG